MTSANQSSGLDQYPDPDPDVISAAGNSAANNTTDYDGTEIMSQLILHPICLYLTAMLLPNIAAPLPQNCTFLDSNATPLCVSALW